MVCNCLTYKPYPKTNPELIDVASYDIDCPVHGWRWDYDGPILTLEEYQAIDEMKALEYGYDIVVLDNFW
jgi:hypothetical protein